MFRRDRLDELLDLHRRSYGLLRWIDHKVQSGAVQLSSLHGALDAGRAAAEWLSRNAASLPHEVRPPENLIDRFAHLFASYLVTSFQISDRKRIRAGCGCDWCSYIVNAPNLRARTPTKLDQQIADQLKLDCLEVLAAEAEAPLFRSELRKRSWDLLAPVDEVEDDEIGRRE